MADIQLEVAGLLVTVPALYSQYTVQGLSKELRGNFFEVIDVNSKNIVKALSSRVVF